MAELNINTSSAAAGGEQKLAVGAMEYDRTAFLDPNSGIRLDRKGRQVDKEGKPITEAERKKIIIDNEQREKYSTFLNNHFSVLARELKNNPELLNGDLHKAERELLQSGVLLDENGNIITEAIDKLLEEKGGAGWRMAIQLHEQSVTERAALLGYKISAEMNRRELIGRTPQVGRVQTGEGQGVLNRAANAVGRFVNRHGTDLLLSTVTVGTGALEGATVNQIARTLMTGDPLVCIEGVALGGAIGGALGLGAVGGFAAGRAAWRSERRSGLIINLDRSVDGFNMVRSDPNEAAYLKAMYGVDINNYRVNATGDGIEEDPNRLSEDNTSMDDIARSIQRDLLTRREFYTKALNIDAATLDAYPERFLDNYLLGDHPELIGAVWQKRLLEKLKPNEPGVITNNYGDNLRNVMQARTDVMMDDVAEAIKSEKNFFDTMKKKIEANIAGNEIDEQKMRVTAINARIRRRTSPEAGSLRKQRIDEINKRQEGLRDDSKQLDEEHQDIVSGQEIIQKAKTEYLTAKQALEDAGYSNVDELDKALKTANSRLTRNRNARDVALKNLIDDFNAFVNTIPDRRGREGEIQVQARFTDDVTKRTEKIYQEKEDRITAQVKHLEDMKKQFKEKEKFLEIAVNAETTTNIDKQLSILEKDYTDVISWDIATGIGLTNNDLVTTPIDLLLRRINEVNRRDPTHYMGWPEGENTRMRIHLEHAIVEARYAEMELSSIAEDPTAAASRQIDHNEIIGFGFTDIQLRALTEDKLNKLSNKIFADSGGARGWDSAHNDDNKEKLKHAVQEAERRLNLHKDAYIRQHNELEEAVNRAEKEKTLPELDNEVEYLTLIENVINSKGEIMIRSRDVITKPDKYGDAYPINAASGGYTEIELKHSRENGGVPGGYYEMLNMLFNYQIAADRREVFQRIVSLLPPDRFADILNRSLNLGVFGPGSDINDVMSELNNRLQNGSLSSNRIRNFVRTTVDQLYNDALLY